MKRVYTYLTLIAIFLTQILFAENRIYNVHSGLSENTVRKIIQDTNGYMWFATKDGLNKFNGREFRVYGSSSCDSRIKNVSPLNIEELLLHKDGRHIWIGAKNGLFLFDPTDESFIHIEENRDINSSAVVVRSLEYDRNNVLWIGTNSGLYTYKENPTHLWRRFSSSNAENNSLLECNINEIFCDSRGILLIGTEHGFFRYDPLLNQFNQMVGNRVTHDINVMSISEDNHGGIWIGTWYDGLFKYNIETRRYVQQIKYIKNGEKLERIRDIQSTRDSDIYICTDTGLYKFDENSTDIVPVKINKYDNRISYYSLLEDKEGGLWFGTYFHGVIYISPKAKAMETYSPVPYAAISQLCPDSNGNIWVATENAGLHLFDPDKKKFIDTPLKNISENIHALYSDEKYLWIGTFSNGLFQVNKKSGERLSYTQNGENALTNNSIYSICPLKNGDLLIGTLRGANRYNHLTKRFSPIKELHDLFIYDIVNDSYGNVWFGTIGNGLYCYDKKEQLWKHYKTLLDTNGKELTQNNILRLHVDAKNQLWICTEGSGIFMYDYVKNCFIKPVVNSFDGLLPSEIVFGLEDDAKGTLWLSTNYGIINYDYKTGNYKNYLYGDGLQSNQFNYRSSLKTEDGRMYFGGINGFNMFYPDKLYKNNVTPTLIAILSYFDSRKKETVSWMISDNKEIVIPRYINSFAIKFECLSYVSPDNNSYKYRFGSNQRWISTKNPEITFTNMKSGRYEFEAKALNSDGYESHSNNVVQLKIKPHILLSTGAIILYCLLGVSAVTLILLEARRKHRQDMLRTLKAMRLKHEQEVYDAKIDFFTNVAHEIKTPLSLIQAPLELIKEHKAWDAETERNIDFISSNTSNLLALVRQLLNFQKINKSGYKLKLENADVVILTNEILKRFTINNKGIPIEFRHEDTSIECQIDTDAYTKIISNLVSNALKYANHRISLSLTSSLEDSNYIISVKVSDDGPGISKSDKEKIFEAFYQVSRDSAHRYEMGVGLGLSMVRLLVEKHGGHVNVSDENEKGFEIDVTLKCPVIDTTESKLYVRTKEEHDVISNEQSEKSELKSILIVEDNIDLLEFLCSNFKKEFRVTGAENGAEALKLLEESIYDLIISDISMPIMDGFELLKNVRNDKMLCHIPFILLSAESSVESKIKGLERGADAYIEKPFSLVHFRAVIDNLIKGRELLQKKFSSEPLGSITSSNIGKIDSEWLKHVDELIISNMNNPEFTIEKLGDALYMSRSNLQRKLKGVINMTPNEYIKLIRLKKAAQLLTEGQYRVSEVAYIVGFNNPSYFSTCFSKQFGMLPNEFISQCEENSNKK